MNKSLNHTLIIASIASLGCMTLLLLPNTADAYVGPGAGLSLLGALWALIVAVAAAVAFIVVWPIRRMRRRKREERELAAQERREDAASAVPDNEADPDNEKHRPRAAPAQEAAEPRRP